MLRKDLTKPLHRWSKVDPVSLFLLGPSSITVPLLLCDPLTFVLQPLVCFFQPLKYWYFPLLIVCAPSRDSQPFFWHQLTLAHWRLLILMPTPHVQHSTRWIFNCLCQVPQTLQTPQAGLAPPPAGFALLVLVPVFVNGSTIHVTYSLLSFATLE